MHWGPRAVEELSSWCMSEVKLKNADFFRIVSDQHVLLEKMLECV